MTLGLVAFLLTAIATWVTMHWYTFVNLAAAGFDRSILAPALWALALLFPITRLLAFRWRVPLITPLFWMGAMWIGLVFLLSFWFLVSSLIRKAFLAAGWTSVDPGPWILVTTALVGGMVLVGMFVALRGPQAVRYTVDRSGRYGAGKSMTMVQISDVHLGLTLGKRYIDKLVESINALEPDMVFITGDLFDPEFPSDAHASAALGRIRAGEGVYAVTGNHEFYSGVDRFLEMMANARIQVLANEIKVSPSGIQIAGIHDISANKFPLAGVKSDTAAALAGIDPARPSVFLAHQPKDLEPAVAKRVDLVLSGHTHAGQIFPFRAVVRMAYKYIGGRYAIGPETDLIVCTGTGFWGPPLRLGSECQIVVADFRY